MYKIIGADGKEYGPITADQLRQWIAEGRANAQTKILPEGATEWKLLSEFPEFASTMPSAPPSLPSGPALGAPGVPGTPDVNGPAVGLIIVAVVGFLLQVAGLIWQAAFSAMAASQMQGQPFAFLFSGAAAVAMHILGIVVSGLILFGRLKMRKLESYGLAMTASILAIIPCISPCCIIGLPIGIWALVILMKPEVKSMFH